MIKTVDFEKRRNEIFLSTVEMYLNTAAPVGSSVLCKTGSFDCSSATIRNILADLEEMDLLTHPHTSAGRIPTDKGYRFYLDFLMEQSRLNEEEKSWVRKVYENRINRIDGVIAEASRVISNLTHYVSIVMSSEDGEIITYNGLSYLIEQPEFRDIEKIGLLFKALEERERLFELINRDFDENVKVYIGKETEFSSEIDDCSVIVAHAGKRDEFGRLAVLGPKRMAYNKVIPLIDYLSELITEMAENV